MRLVCETAELLADEETPISIYLRMGAGAGTFLLESAEGGERLGRHSFMGFHPLLRVIGREGTLTLRTEGSEEVRHGNLWRELKRFCAEIERVGVYPEGFAGGLIGYFGYDMVRQSETLPNRPPDDRGLPDLDLMLPALLLTYDHRTRVLRLNALAIETSDETSARRAARRRLAEALRAMERPHVPAPLLFGTMERLQPQVGKARFVERVRRAKEHIAAGDIFQVVLSERLEALYHGRPLDVYRRLRMLNPSPYLFFLNLDDDTTLIGSSPEMLVKVEEGVVSMRPIAGTRPRGRTADDDGRLRQELVDDAKEQAEHVMLLDLGRNDVGRVSAPGTVKVTDMMNVEKYSHVWHLVSRVQGELHSAHDGISALEACFPAGTLSGAPKVRAMEIIDDLESVARGPYGGAVGYIGLDGSVDTCITIRTAVLHRGIAYLQAGAGIVADSVPEREYEECMHKAGAMVAALGGEGGLEG